MISRKRRNGRSGLLLAMAGFTLSACSEPLDFDMRGFFGEGFSTSEAAQNAANDRPPPDDRGIISYPNYQVAVAQRGDTVLNVSDRVGLPADEVASFNGVKPTTALREGEIVALPRRVAEPRVAVAALDTPGVDVTTLAGQAIENAAVTPPATPAAQALPPLVNEPIRHRVERGETAYTIARLYDVPARSIAEWNGLDSDFAVREGQYLLIPAAQPAPAVEEEQPVVSTTPLPGVGSDTPTPPSASKPLPEDDTATVQAAQPQEPVVELETTQASSARMILPAKGSIIREYAKGRNEGIDIKGAPGDPVIAADTGTVAAITESSDGVPILVLRHPDNLLTVYANVDKVSVRKGDSVDRGDTIAQLRGGDQSYVHFEVRDGFDSVDPMPYLR